MNIRDYRLRLGLTQLELAEALNIPLRTLARWEGGGAVPRAARTELFLARAKALTASHAAKLRETLHAQAH